MIPVLQLILRIVAKFLVGFSLLYAVVYVLLFLIFSLFRLISKSYLANKGKAESWPSSSYKGVHVMVTGGSSGIGLEIARLYLKEGAKVTIVARNVKKLQEAKEDLLKTVSDESRLKTVSCDVGSSEEEVSKSFAQSIGQFGSVDILINCAGTSIAGEFDKLDSNEFERMLRINVLGSVFPTRCVVAGMKEKRRGRIVFVSSQVAQAAIHGYSAYAASKWALRGVAEALQMELKPYNISVSISYPPDTDTPGYKEEMLTKPLLTKEISETGSVVSPVEVAKDIVYYSSQNYYGISTGFDGWLIKQPHGGMSPVNNAWEVTQQIMFASPIRFIASVYVLYWDLVVAMAVGKAKEDNTKKTN